MKLKDTLWLCAVISAVFLLLAGLLFFGKNKKAEKPVHTGELVAFTITDTKTGIKYVRCPRGVGAVYLDKVYLRCGENGPELYSIKHENPEKYLSEAKNALGGAYVYRAEDTPEISLSLFNPVSAGIFMDGIEKEIDYFIAEDAAMENSALESGYMYVLLISQALLSAKEAVPTGEFEELEFYIRLYSKAYPGLYYECVFLNDENGISYLLDAVTGTLVLSPDLLTLRING